MKKQIVVKFNELICEFVVKLKQTYPHDETELENVEFKLNMVSKISAYLVIQAFIQHVCPMKDLIESKHDSVFLEHSGEFMLFKNIDMKTNWLATPDETKEAIWSYMTLLLEIALAYQSDTSSHLNTDVTVMPDYSFDSAIRAAQEVNDRFIKENQRDPLADDDLSSYAQAMADKLGINFANLSELQINPKDLQSFMNNDEVLKNLNINPDHMKDISQFVVKQMQNLQNKQRTEEEKNMLTQQ